MCFWYRVISNILVYNIIGSCEGCNALRKYLLYVCCGGVWNESQISECWVWDRGVCVCI